MFDDFLKLIGTVGFPIAAYLLLYLDLRRIIERHNETLNRLIETLKLCNIK